MKNIVYQLAAAITFFTRIPLWKVVEIPAESFKKLICFWPFTGWITAGLTALAWLGFSMLFPPTLAIVLSFLVRYIFTGGLHEDGLADFFDGFGGGNTKADILRIMKDTQVGSYALVGMIFYYLLLINTALLIPIHLLAILIFVADPISKTLTGLMINLLPYARTEQESKAKTLFDKLKVGRIILLLFFGLIPCVLFLNFKLWLAMLFPLVTVCFIYLLVKKKIGGYTGDVCGATALLCELSFYMGVYLLVSW